MNSIKKSGSSQSTNEILFNDALLKEQIYITLRHHPLHLNLLYGQMDVHLANSAQLNLDALSIPIHPRLTDDEVSPVIDKINGFFC